MRKLEKAIKSLLLISNQINFLLAAGKILNKIPFMGIVFSILLDRLILFFYALDVSSRNIFVDSLQIPHPVGILLGGNGIRSRGRVIINAGAKFVGKSPRDPAYLDAHRKKSVFVLGDRVVVGANVVLIGPLTICDNVLIGAGSVVTKNILEAGTYIGIPAKKISDQGAGDWFS